MELRISDNEIVEFTKNNFDRLSNTEIAKVLGCSVNKVSNICQKYKIKKDHSSIRRRMFKGGFVHPMKGKPNPLTTKRNFENNPMKNYNIREKARESRINNGAYKRTSDRMKKENPSFGGLSNEWKERISLASKRRWKEENYRSKMILVLKKMRDLAKSPQSIEKRKKKAREQWANEDSRKKLLEGLAPKPNVPERKLIKIICENNLPFNFVGDGKIWFKGENHSFNPDFLSKNPKHIIEIYGEYHHNLTKNKIKHEERIKTYESYGYKTLVIWSKELKDEKNIINKIRDFINK